MAATVENSLPSEQLIPATSWIRTARAPDRLVINRYLLFAILATEAIAIFVYRLPQTLTFNDFAFFDTGSNLTIQSLIDRGYRPGIDFSYQYGLLPLLFGRVWFGLCGLTPIACVAVTPLMDLLIIWGFVRLAANLKLNLAGVLLILLTATLTVPSSFLNLAHIIETSILIHALADQAGGNRRRALALATTAVFVKPSMAYFLGLVLLVFIVAECLQDRTPLRALLREIYPAALIGLVIGIILTASFGLAPLLHTVIPSEGRALYHAQGYGFFSGAGRTFIAPHGASLSYYLVSKAGLWIVYTIVLVLAALLVARDALSHRGTSDQADRTPELILTCAALHLSFVIFFFGNESSWGYYVYLLVLGLAAIARLGLRWEVLVACLAFAIPITKVDQGIVRRFASSRHETLATPGRLTSGMPSVAVPTGESAFGYQLWSTTAPRPETAGLWTTPDERHEWIKVLAMIRGHSATVLDDYGCADLLFPEFSPPTTFFLQAGGVTPADLSRKLPQLQTSSMIVMPRWQIQLLDDIPEIGAVVRRDFVPAFQGEWFIVYSRHEG